MTNCCKKPYLMMIAGLFLTLVLWFGTLPSLGGFQLQLADGTHLVDMPYIENSTPESAEFTMQMTLHALPFQSTIMRIAPDDCITDIRINYVSIAPRYLPTLPMCFSEVLAIDLAPYISAGANTITMYITDKGGLYGVNIKMVHSTFAMCLIALSLGVFLYGAFLACGEKVCMSLRGSPGKWALIAAMLAFAVVGRMYYIEFVSSDFYHYLRHWLEYVRRYGLGHAYGYNFSDYSPLYTYLIGISDLFIPVHAIYTIKFLTFAGDIAMAWLVYCIVKKYRTEESLSPIIAACLFLISPSFIVNGAVAAQCDVFYTFFLLAAMLCLLRERMVLSIVLYGVAISFKFQAVFLSPFLLIFILRRKLPLRLLLIPPAIYFISILPCWFQGRDMKSLLMVYLNHFNNRPDLGVAGNFYYLLYQYFSEHVAIISYIGIAVTTLVAMVFASATHQRWRDRNSLLEYVLLSTFCMSLMIFLLPKMLDRYFYPAEIFALLLGCLRPRWIMIAVLFQLATLLVYFRSNLPALPYDLSYETAHHIALVLDLIAIVWLGRLCYRHIWQKTPVVLD